MAIGFPGKKIMAPNSFIAIIAPDARASMAVTKIPSSFCIAEASLESGWGESMLTKQARNFFGVKADASWKGDILTMNTREFLNNEWVVVPAKWRKYATYLECLADHAAFLMTNPRYKPAFMCADGESFCQAVGKAGYATDPNYSGKLISIIRKYNLSRFDK